MREIQDIAQAIIPVFQAQGISREALAAWLLFSRAAQEDQLSTRLLRRLAEFLARSSRDPESRFEPPVPEPKTD